MNKVKVFIASDHAALDLKSVLVAHLGAKYEVVDLGPQTQDSVDYPDYAHKLAEQVLAEGARGILLCGSGIGMSIAANRHEGIRAALCHCAEYAKLSREHNDSNVLVLGARFTSPDLALEITDTWFATDFEGGRHQKRIDKINLGKVIS